MTEEKTVSGNGGRVGIEKRFELAEGYVKTVLGLSTGALVLSITFLHDIVGLGSEGAPARIGWRCLLEGGWACLLVSVVASLFYLYHLAIAAKYASAYSWELRWGAIVSSGAFVAGLAMLSVFAALHLR